MTRIFLRPLGTPLALGLFGVGVQSTMLAALELGWIPPTEGTIVAITGLAFAFPLQFLAAILAFLARDAIAGTGLGTFSGTWAVTSLSLLATPPGGRSEGLGVFLILAAILLTCVVVAAVAGGARKLVVALVLGVGAVRVLVTGLYEVNGAGGLEQAAAILGLCLGGAGIYAGLALLMEDVRHATLLPTLRSGRARAAIGGDMREQLTRVENEAGVREQL